MRPAVATMIPIAHGASDLAGHPGPGDGMMNMVATFFTFGCLGGAGFAVYSLMGNGKKIEGRG